MQDRILTVSERESDSMDTLREIRVAKEEIKDLKVKLNKRYHLSVQIDNKYSLFRNRYILRTGKIPDLSYETDFYVNMEFLENHQETVDMRDKDKLEQQERDGNDNNSIVDTTSENSALESNRENLISASSELSGLFGVLVFFLCLVVVFLVF